jgi:hypothetical protein
MRNPFPLWFDAVACFGSGSLLAGCASSAVREMPPVQLDPYPESRLMMIISASVLARFSLEGDRGVKVINDGPGSVGVEVFNEAAGTPIDPENAAEVRALPPKAERSFESTKFKELMIVNRSERSSTIRFLITPRSSLHSEH